MRVALYARVSSQEQAEEKCSIEMQVQAVEGQSQRQGDTVVKHYIDIQSGRDIKKDREQFEQMLKDAKLGLFDKIVAWRPDRLFRGLAPAAKLARTLDETGITIEGVIVPIDRNLIGLWAWVAEQEIEAISARTQGGREGNIKKGNNHTHPPFGWDYDRDTKRWVINGLEAKWVCQMFDWYITGVSLYEIARRLNNAGVPTKNHSKLGWTAQKVSELVNGECYTGIAYYNKRRGATNKPKDKSQWIPMSVPAIISQETWQAAQAKRQSNKPFSPRNTKTVYLTQHILVCEECSKSFLIHSGNGQARLVCRGMTLHPHLYNCRSPKTMKYQPIADRLWDGVKEVLESEGGLQAAIQSRVEYVAQRREAIERKLKELSQKLANLEKEKDIVITGFRKEFYTEEELQRQLQAVEEDNQRYKTEIDSLLADMRLQGNAQTIYQQAKQLVPIMQERLNSSLSGKEKQDIIKLLVRRALLDSGGNLTIEFAVPAPDSFACATSLHAESPDYRPGRGGVGEPASRWI